MVNIAINGFGRIGRLFLRALSESKNAKNINVKIINDLADLESNIHLFKYDSIHGTYNKKIKKDKNSFDIGLGKIQIISETNPLKLPWKKNKIDIVIECTGILTSKKDSLQHIKAGAKKVIISAPSDNPDITVVYGVNHKEINNNHKIISNASCTTNCLAPIAKAINDTVGIEQGSMTTIHAYTNDQNLSDVYHPDLYRARSATQSMIPTKTGAAKAVGLVLPELAGKLDGMAVRVPTINVSLVDLTFVAKRETTAAEINEVVKAASEGAMQGILEYNELPLVSIDFNHNPASSIFDSTQTKVDGKLVKVMAWYDNEWGFSNRMLDQVKALGQFL